MKVFRVAAALAAVALGASLAACNSSTGSPVSNVPGVNAQLRFINGSPSAGNVTWYIDGNQQDQNVVPSTQGMAPAGSITTYKTTTAATHTLTFTNSTGGQVAVTNTCNTNFPSLTSGSRNTVVLAGNGTTAAPYLCEFFNEPGYNTTQPSVIFHHAALLAVVGNSALGQVYGGYEAPATSTTVNNLGAFSNPISAPPGAPAQFTNITPQSGQSGGIAFTVSASAGGTPLATLTPSQVDSTNTGNVMPFNGNDTNLAAYVVDTTSGVALIGTFTP